MSALPGPDLAAHVRTRRDGSLFMLRCGGCEKWGHLWTKCCDRHKLLVVGDSHSSVWTTLQEKHFRRAMVLRLRIGGMSAHGLANNNSRSQAAVRIRHKIRQVQQLEWLVVVAGQVDVDFLAHLRLAARAPLGGSGGTVTAPTPSSLMRLCSVFLLWRLLRHIDIY